MGIKKVHFILKKTFSFLPRLRPLLIIKIYHALIKFKIDGLSIFSLADKKHSQIPESHSSLSLGLSIKAFCSVKPMNFLSNLILIYLS